MGNKIYSVKETTMKKLADNIREITGTTGEIKGDSLFAVVENTTEEIDIQTDLIGQIQTALQGKAAGGSNEDVTAETDAYTSKIASLETAVTTLEAELKGKAGGGSGGSVETYDLVITSDGVTKASVLNYVAYINGTYEYHSDSVINVNYPYTASNVVLRVPITIIVSGGYEPRARVEDGINYIIPTDYRVDVITSENGSFLPLNSKNGKITVSCQDED